MTTKITRRTFAKNAAALASGMLASSPGCAAIVTRTARKKSDVRIENISFGYDEHIFRAPVGFAGAVVRNATMVTVRCSVRTAGGKVAGGFGSMPFNHTFSFPSKKLSDETKNNAMKALATELAKVTSAYQEFGHPLDINWDLAPLYLKAAAEVSERLRLADPIPKLCTLVTAAAFDAAIHDAFGKAQGKNSFDTYGPEFMSHDLSRYLGPEYKGKYPSDYLLPQHKPRMTLCHLVSAVDPIEDFENTKPIKDGLPETLPEWINHNGLLELKIKVNGTDLKWDLERVMHIDQVTTRTQEKRGVKDWAYLLDFNEKCPNVDYFIQFCRQLKEKMPIGYQRIKYTEQPTARDLKVHPEHDMHEAARICPVVIDESLTDVDSLLLARKLGWSGAAVKSPKGLSHMILIASVAGKEKIFLCGGDMSCPGAALIQTANLQARVPTITSVEANARQYLPQANKAWESRFPGMFRVTDGLLQTQEISGPGLGAGGIPGVSTERQL
ncbi:MAG TPA: enolase C-terminal domain-like protein [Candidatus Binatia bacterium]|nr:enolase C-terminal domain-like protein [Candidatus Binatia bacterium]